MNSYDILITLMFQNRNQLLASSDKYVLPDYPIASSNLELVKKCRQQLKDYMGLDQVNIYNSSSNIQLPPFPMFLFKKILYIITDDRNYELV